MKKKKENTPKRPSSRCGRRTHGKPRVLRAVRRAVQATVVLEKHCVNLLDTKLVVGSEQDVCSLVKLLLVGAARPSVGSLHLGAGRPLPGIQASRLSSSMSAGSAILSAVGRRRRGYFCAAPRICDFIFLKRLPFRFFLTDRNSREMGEKGPEVALQLGGRINMWTKKIKRQARSAATHPSPEKNTGFSSYTSSVVNRFKSVKSRDSRETKV